MPKVTDTLFYEQMSGGLLVPRRNVREYLQERNQQLPDAIFPELLVIRADTPTQNKTFYPEASLRGKPSKGTGLISFTRPYAIPIIKDHNTGGGFFGGESSEIYGRVFDSAQFIKDPDASYVRAVPSITHEFAIESILTGRWKTTSLGSRTESVTCSICGEELTSEDCEHIRGQTYEVDGEEREALWVIGPIKAKEISFVVSPSDEAAGVINPNVKESAGAPATRILVGDEKGLWDLGTGKRVADRHPLMHEARRYCPGFRMVGALPVKESTNKKLVLEDDDDETPLSLGALYALPDDHPDFNTPDDATDEAQNEAPLSTKARNKLPDSAFCGPNRTFPAHDAAHVRNGLARLSQSKLSSSQKATTKACLEKRAKRFGIKVSDKEMNYAAKLIDRQHGVEIDLYPLPATLEALDLILGQVAAMPHTEDEQGAILQRLALATKDAIEAADWQRIFGDLSEIEAGDPVAIEITAENYALIYTAMQNGLLAPAPAAEKTEEPVAKDEPAEGDKGLEPAPTDKPADPPAEPKEEGTEKPADPPAPKRPTLAEIRARVTPPAPTSEPATDTKEKETPVNEVAKLEEKLAEANRKLHESTAKSVALYMRALRRPKARGKTLEQLVTELSTRTLESLHDTLDDLTQELEAGGTPAALNLPVLEDPTTKETTGPNDARIAEAGEEPPADDPSDNLGHERNRIVRPTELEKQSEPNETLLVTEYLGTLYADLKVDDAVC